MKIVREKLAKFLQPMNSFPENLDEGRDELIYRHIRLLEERIEKIERQIAS